MFCDIAIVDWVIKKVFWSRPHFEFPVIKKKNNAGAINSHLLRLRSDGRVVYSLGFHNR